MQKYPGSGLPLVSVIISTYNRASMLRLSIESVLAQTYVNIEIIVVDDGSTDNTAELMRHYAGRVSYIKQPHQGVSAARNAGIRAASGEYVNFLDDDDLFMPYKIERQVQVLQNQADIDLVYCGYYHVDLQGEPLGKAVNFPTGQILASLLRRCFLLIHTPLVRRYCLERVGGFDQELGWCEDWQLWLRMALAGYQFACMPEPLCAYRVQPGNKSKNRLNVEQSAFAILTRFFAEPELPADILALKDEAYGQARIWNSWKFYGAGLWHDAQRNLTQALTHLPRLLIQPAELLISLRNEALSVYVKTPIQFITDVFDHLPPCAVELQRYRTDLLSEVHTGLALRHYGFGQFAAAQQELLKAISLNPLLLQQTDEFAALVLQRAQKLPTDTPLKYVEAVFANLPAAAQRLTNARARVLVNFA